jgi:hypothetical protein
MSGSEHNKTVEASTAGVVFYCPSEIVNVRNELVFSSFDEGT